MAGSRVPERRVTAIVSGLVQAVGFRDFVRREAEGRGITGYVRNCDDGRRVEVVAEGSEDAIEALVRALHAGPTFARVDRVEAQLVDATREFDRFRVEF